jgi:pyruvate/2-oxoacid:ferredoxin oxidoreductase alpha subunit
LKLSPKLDNNSPITFATYAAGELCTEYRFKHCAALDRAKTKIEEIEEEFHEIFGRKYGGQIEEYKSQDADIVLLTMGSTAGTAKVVIDKKRDEGLKVGLVKVRMMRPFPREKLVHALRGKKALGVIERSVSFGWNAGPLFVDLKAALNDLDVRIPILNFIGGLGGSDVNQGHIERVVTDVQSATKGGHYKEVTWLSLE